MDAIFAALQALERGPEPRPAAAPAPPPPPKPAPAPPPAPPLQAVQPRQARPPAAGLLQGLFEDGNSLLRAVIAAEVLQPPLALREAQDRLPGEP